MRLRALFGAFQWAARPRGLLPLIVSPPPLIVQQANNTYTGGTTISAGTLQVGNGFTTGSIVGDVIDNGTLAFNRANTLSFGGTISAPVQ
jgi:autotransporter-associated beta strand protein